MRRGPSHVRAYRGSTLETAERKVDVTDSSLLSPAGSVGAVAGDETDEGGGA
jgi:hypothetical protein